ncbi:hypothetical protein [Haloferax mucosum]|nr:hypothetical protein [Haloferax mucosum]
MTDDETEADSTLDGEVDASTGEDADDSPVGGSTDETNQQAADGGRADENGYGDETVPHVELELYELSVRVSGQSDDGLEEVEASATRLMDLLIDHTKQLEDQPDTRGLG